MINQMHIEKYGGSTNSSRSSISSSPWILKMQTTMDVIETEDAVAWMLQAPASSTSTNSEAFKSGDIKNGSYSISMNAPIKIVKAAKSSLNDSDYVVTEYDTTYTRQDCDVSFETSYSLNKQLSSSNLKNEINTNSKSFINKIKSKVSGENFLLVSENYDINQFNGNSSSSQSFSSKHKEDLYKVKTNPYLGSVN